MTPRRCHFPDFAAHQLRAESGLEALNGFELCSADIAQPSAHKVVPLDPFVHQPANRFPMKQPDCTGYGDIGGRSPVQIEGGVSCIRDEHTAKGSSFSVVNCCAQ